MQGFGLHLCMLRNEGTDNLPPSAKGSRDDGFQGSQAALIPDLATESTTGGSRGLA